MDTPLKLKGSGDFRSFRKGGCPKGENGLGKQFSPCRKFCNAFSKSVPRTCAKFEFPSREIATPLKWLAMTIFLFFYFYPVGVESLFYLLHAFVKLFVLVGAGFEYDFYVVVAYRLYRIYERL